MQKRLALIYLMTLCLFFVLTTCKNPFKSETKKELIKVLVNDYFNNESLGKWVFFWNGKNKDGKFVSPGKYIYIMEAHTFQDQDFVTAEAGGVNEENDQSHFEAGFWYDFELGQAYPNPFPIKSGVNIPAIISEAGTVKISIYKN
jgi:hypothetical protein